MATLERRVQVLFNPAQYAELEAEAASRNQSVAAVIRESVEDRLRTRRTSQSEALARLFARADSQSVTGPIRWDDEKDAFERDSLRDLP